MLVKVKTAFPYAHDGFTIQQLAAGDEVEVHDELVDQLADDELIERPKAKAAKPAAGDDGKD